MRTSSQGIALIQHFEDCALEAYPDPGTGGAPWTIGWGHTGQDVYPGLVITQARADELLRQDLERFERDVCSLARVELLQCQFDALVSFAFNCGSDIDADTKAEGLGDSTLMRLVNEGRFDQARFEFGKWIRAGGRVLRGLIRRRAAEAALFMGATAQAAIRHGMEAA